MICLVLHALPFDGVQLEGRPVFLHAAAVISWTDKRLDHMAKSTGAKVLILLWETKEKENMRKSSAKSRTFCILRDWPCMSLVPLALSMAIDWRGFIDLSSYVFLRGHCLASHSQEILNIDGVGC